VEDVVVLESEQARTGTLPKNLIARSRLDAPSRGRLPIMVNGREHEHKGLTNAGFVQLVDDEEFRRVPRHACGARAWAENGGR
jgi:hypothetical protein